MTILLADTFVGSGDLDGRTPDTTFDALNWVDDSGAGNLVLSGGYVGLASPAYFRSMSVGDSAVLHGLAAEADIDFVFRTGSNVTPTDTYLPLAVEAYYANDDMYFYGVLDSAPSSGVWTLTLASNGTVIFPASDSDTVTLAPNTDYPGKLSLRDGTQTLTFLGATLTINTTYGLATGIERFRFGLGADHLLGEVLADDLSDVTGDVSFDMPITAEAAGTHYEPPVGDVDAVMPITTDAVGVVGVTGEGAALLDVSGAAAGVLGVAGTSDAVMPISIAASGLGAVVAPAVSIVLTFTATAAGEVPPSGRAAAVMHLTAEAAGDRGIVGAAVASMPFFTTTEASHGRTGVAAATMTLRGAASGSVGIGGVVAAVVPFTAAALGSTPMSYFGAVDAQIPITVRVRQPAAAVSGCC